MNFENLAKEYKQEHLLEYYNQLDDDKKGKLEEQLMDFDCSLLDLLVENPKISNRGEFSPISVLKIDSIQKDRVAYEERGLRAISSGEVAVVLLAGGQGSRLGYNGPKGSLNVGKTKEIFIFQILIDDLKKVANNAKNWIHLYIMTSEINNKETIAFLEQHKYFGYPSEYVHFFVQEMAPAVDFEGKLFMSDKDSLAYSPNGNGGWFSSLVRSGLLQHVKDHGIKWLNVISVDNVLQKVADPVFIGATYEANVTCGAKVIKKSNPYEKVGVLCYENGVPSIVEYYDLADEMANMKDQNGDLLYGYGVILNYLFRIDNLEKMYTKKLPIHLAKKKISYVTADGIQIEPKEENGYKFECLILDMIQYMDSCLPYEVIREKEFAPIKNKVGVDSLESAQALLEANNIQL